jgi:hypothetical protein
MKERLLQSNLPVAFQLQCRSQLSNGQAKAFPAFLCCSINRKKKTSHGTKLHTGGGTSVGVANQLQHCTSPLFTHRGIQFGPHHLGVRRHWATARHPLPSGVDLRACTGLVVCACLSNHRSGFRKTRMGIQHICIQLVRIRCSGMANLAVGTLVPPVSSCCHFPRPSPDEYVYCVPASVVQMAACVSRCECAQISVSSGASSSNGT